VTSTALACGWSNPSAFIETFRRAFGATPGKFYADPRPPYALTGALQIPTEPSRVSRMMSAWPACRAVSSIRWNRT
jgi:AraC-like DNA-binding protein